MEDVTIVIPGVVVQVVKVAFIAFGVVFYSMMAFCKVRDWRARR